MLTVKLARMKRSIQRLRLERAFILEKLEECTPSADEDSNASDSSVHSFKREKDSSHSENHDPFVHSNVRDTVPSFIQSQSASSATTTSSRRRRTRDPDAPKRPSNPFLKFCDVQREKIRSENEGVDRFDVTRALGAAWQNLDDESRKPYYDAYELEKKQFKIKMDEYESGNSRLLAQQSKSTSSNESNVRQKHLKNLEKHDIKPSRNTSTDLDDDSSSHANYNQELVDNDSTKSILPMEFTPTSATFSHDTS
ncbi:uncharacterized protein T551_01491 [Pneumocystis jirovecii RU7]|uniref:HMG box domain-containing protein n=1 Tax=Pneumocystis jirovecii (strain RU7) TaxID=1408657 RepID=A0A0W4ZRD5_PNEJ7|nr:uncharacterized protein T551_01491 [Pneumocystis jirovecii RU7]KTW30939.1 hypothetical protein T551_01491 [Pneumocystis jirovecii RU7]